MTPLLRGVLAGLAAAGVLAWPASRALDDLAAARADRRAAAALLAAGAADDGAAGDRIAARLRGAATGGGLLVERAAPLAAGGVALTVSGADAGVFAFVDAVERDGVRLAAWRIERAGGVLRLTARAVAGMSAPDGETRAVFAHNPFGAAAEVEPPADAPELAGIVGRIGRDAVALVRVGAATRTVAPGDSVDGWRLETLSADAALFTRGATRARVELPADDQ